MPSLESSKPDVNLLDAASFASLGALRIAAETNANPSLLLVESHQLSDVLDWLDASDDVCLRDTPPALIEHRANCLRRSLESKLDPLTRVLSRQHLIETLDTALSEASPDHPVSLILCDLDRFKSINDQYGHAAGDEILRQVAGILKRHADRSSAVGRIGGEEFAVVCRRDAAASLMLAEEVRRRVRDCRFEADLRVTMSVGLAAAREHIPGREIIQQANHALYSAKANGRDGCVNYHEMESDCRDAGCDVEVVGLENQARVLAERVAGYITMRSRQLISTVRREADVDGLTQCFNRRCLDRRLADDFERRREQPLSVAFVDLDHFGSVNKRHGWPTGDKLLVEVCDVIRGEIRESDWIGRYGGEEFCIVMPDTNGTDAARVLARIRRRVQDACFVSTVGEPVPMTLSIGGATAQTDDDSYLELLDRASGQALDAKRNGRNRLSFAE